MESIETGETLRRPYQQRELSIANNFERMEPQQRQKKMREEEDEERKERKAQKRRQREGRDNENIIEERLRGHRVQAIF